MCGRHTLLRVPRERRGGRFDVEVIPELAPPRFNVAPSQIAPVVRQVVGHELIGRKWGLAPNSEMTPG
jgi:putative SOS response-associated peptidase YedK